MYLYHDFVLIPKRFLSVFRFPLEVSYSIPEQRLIELFY